MPICALTPTVRIYEDFDKMSAKEVYFNESGDKIIVKLLHDQSEILKSSSDGAKNVTADDSAASSTASNTTCDTNKTKRPYRKFSDGRKRSTSNQVYKCSKAFAETHHNSTMPSQTVSVRKTSVGSKQSGTTVSTSSNVATVIEPVKLKQPYVSRRYLGGPSTSSSAGGLRKQILTRQSVSPSAIVDDYDIIGTSLSTGYMQYQMSLLAVPMPRDYGDASSDDLSSEWDSDVPAERQSPKVNIILIYITSNKINSPLIFYLKSSVGIYTFD